MFWYVHLAFSVPGTLPLEYRTKPIFNAGWASEARATDAPAEANTKAVSETPRNNDLNMKFPVFLFEEGAYIPSMKFLDDLVTFDPIRTLMTGSLRRLQSNSKLCNRILYAGKPA